MADITRIKNKVYEVTNEFFNIKGIALDENTTLESLDFEDSLKFMSYIIAIEDEFCIEIPAEGYSQFKTLGNIIDYIEDYLRYING